MNVSGKFLPLHLVHTNTISQWHMLIISLTGAMTLMIVTQANKLNLKIRNVEIFHYTYRYTVLFNTKTVFVREGDERQQRLYLYVLNLRQFLYCIV